MLSFHARWLMKFAGAGKDATAVKAIGWAELRQVQNVPVPPSLERWDLGAGESQVIAYGLLNGRLAALDDLAARRCADARGLFVIGTMGIVLRSKQRGLLPEAKPWIVRLRNAGMYIDPAVVTASRRPTRSAIAVRLPDSVVLSRGVHNGTDPRT